MVTFLSPHESTSKDWLDGPGLVAWCRERNILPRENTHGYLSKRFREWEQGCAANVYTVDALMVKEGRHLSELPDELWRSSPKRPTRKNAFAPYPKALRQQVLYALKQGLTPTLVSREFGIGVRTVQNWKRQEKERVA